MINLNTTMHRIQNRRLELKLSYQDLASKTNMSKSTLQRYETGAIKNIPIDKLIIIAKALDVSPLWLMGFDENNINDKLSNEEKQLISDLRNLNDLGKKKVFTYTKDLIDNPKFNSINNDISNTSETEGLEPYLIACHDDNLTDEEKNHMNKIINDFLKKKNLNKKR